MSGNQSAFNRSANPAAASQARPTVEFGQNDRVNNAYQINNNTIFSVINDRGHESWYFQPSSRRTQAEAIVVPGGSFGSTTEFSILRSTALATELGQLHSENGIATLTTPSGTFNGTKLNEQQMQDLQTSITSGQLSLRGLPNDRYATAMGILPNGETIIVTNDINNISGRNYKMFIGTEDTGMREVSISRVSSGRNGAAMSIHSAEGIFGVNNLGELSFNRELVQKLDAVPAFARGSMTGLDNSIADATPQGFPGAPRVVSAVPASQNTLGFPM